MNDKERFLTLCNNNIKREGIDKLLEWLSKTDFFTAPASTKFHLAEEGGLLKHSLNVFDMLNEHNLLEKTDIESIAICGLFHDICNANFYKVDYRNSKNEQGVWEKVPYFTVEEKFPYGHGEKSVFILGQYIKLTTAEAMAINWHMGGFDERVKGGSFSLGNAYEKYPLAVELNIADMRATYLAERKN